MLSLRNRFGIPGVISVIALVFAMFGGAYAASGDNGSGDATASASKRGGNVNKLIKRESRKFSKVFSLRFAKRFPGPIGPQGFPGLPGAPGDDGSDGSDGSDGQDGTSGDDGADGNTVLSGNGPPGAGDGVDGDFYIDTSTQEIYGPKTTGDPNNGWGFPTSLQGEDGDDGDDGSPWVAGTAPNGAVLKGTWSVQPFSAAGPDEEVAVPVSTGVPVNAAATDDETLAAYYVPPGGPDPFGACPGSASNPTATAPGLACVYGDTATNFQALAGGGAISIQVGQSGGGVILKLRSVAAGTVSGYGSWALIAP